MKQKLLVLLLLSFLFSRHFATAQNTFHPKWMSKNPFEQKVIIENKGQYQLPADITTSSILFGARQGGLQYYFTSTGIFISRTVSIKRSAQEIEQIEKKLDQKEKDDDDNDSWKYKRVEQFHEMNFEGAALQTTVTADSEVSWTYNYTLNGNDNIQAHAWKKLTYNNLYPGIDMQFFFPEDEDTGPTENSKAQSFEYSFIVHPGADISQIKIKYNGSAKVNSDGTVTIKSVYGNFTEYAPAAKLLSSNKVVNCGFSLSNGQVKFNAKGYDKSEILLIDPLVITPTFGGSNSAFDIDWDKAGNIYAYGGIPNGQILKYNSKGVLVWNYAVYSVLDVSYLGGFAVDRNSQSVYVTEGVDDGTGARVLKLNRAGAEAALFNGNSNMTEMWEIAFSTCSNQAVIGGGGVSAPSFTASYLDTNLTDLNLVNTLQDYTAGYHDMWSLAIDDFGNSYMITCHSHGPEPNSFDNDLLKLPLPNLAPTTWLVPSHYNFLETSSMDYAYNTSNGYNGMGISDTTLYTYDSYVIKKWGTHSGKLLDSIFVNGVVNDDSKDATVDWGGLSVDDCGNVFVGSHDSVKQYDYNLNFVQAYVQPNTVYDVKLSLSDTLYASGIGYISATAVNLPPCHIIQATNTITDVTCAALGSATISGVSGGTPPYTIVWNTSPVIMGNSATELRKGTYIATITDSSCPRQIYADTIKILGPLRLQLSTNSDTVCQGVPVTITASNGTNYTWYPSTGLNTTTGTSVIATPAITTTYNVIGTVNNGGCLDTESVVITINPLPVLAINPALPSICYGQSISLTASGAPSYEWSPSNSLSSTTNSTVTASPTVTTTYTLQGTSASGCVTSAKLVLEVNPIPIVSISPPATTICAGKSTNLTASGATTYQWSPQTSLSSTSGSPITVNPVTSTTYTVIGTSLGCSDTTNIAIRVIQDSLKVSTNNTSVCQGNSVDITASGANTYNWSPSTGLNKSTSDTVTATPTITTTYTLIAVGNSCPDTEKVVVTVNLPPVLSIEPANPSICVGHPTSLSVSGASTYTWSPSAGLNQTNGSSVTANPTATTTYTAYGTDALGCNDSSKVVLKVNPLPVVTAAPLDTLICHGLSVSLTATGASTYQWSPSTGLSSATNSVVTAAPTITTTYTVYGTDALGCADTTMVTVNIIQNSINVALQPANDIICLGNSAVVTASGGNNYVWSPSTALSSTTGSSITANPVTSTTYTVIGTGTGNCADTSKIRIAVSPPPTITVNPQLPVICNGQAISITASGALSYQWSPSIGLYNTAGSVVDAHPTATTTYTVYGTDSLGCNDSTKFTLNVDAPPVGAFTFSAPQVCYPLQLQFSNTTTGGISYLWYFGDGDSSTVQNPSHTFLKPGIYKITLYATSVNGCTDTVSKSDTLSNYNAGVFVPNSFTPGIPGINQLFKPNVECTAASNYLFRVYDRWGILLYETNDPTDGWDGIYKGKMQPLDVYVYYIQMTCGTCNFFQKGDVTLLR